jgi:Uma2 family endonuclease
MAVSAKHIYTPEQYLQVERASDEKSEYVGGEVYAMSGASRAHNLIAGNIYRSLGNQFEGRPCEAYMSDMRVGLVTAKSYFYPDVAAVCGESLFEDTHVDTLMNPSLIIEVLSPTTELFDRSMKFARYLKIGSLHEYVLVAQDQIRVERYARQPDGARWLFEEITDPNGVLRLESVGCEIALSAIYERVHDLAAEGQSVGEEVQPEAD